MQINEIIEISKSNTILGSIKDYQLLRNVFGLGKSLSWSKKKKLFSAWDLIKDNSEETQAKILKTDKYTHPFLNSFKTIPTEAHEINFENISSKHYNLTFGVLITHPLLETTTKEKN